MIFGILSMILYNLAALNALSSVIGPFVGRNIGTKSTVRIRSRFRRNASGPKGLPCAG